MIRSLHIENYVLIDSLDVAFPEGLAIITGQTGAGKSILLGALSLVLGAKADASHISDGAESCVVEAEFDIDGNAELRELLDSNEVEWDGGHLIVRRVLNRSGRSRSFVNDSPVSGAVLASLGTSLVDIHSQHQSLLLSDRKFQLSVLDRFAGITERVEACRGLWAAYRSKSEALGKLRESADRMSFDYEYNAARLKQLKDARLRDGELEELEEEQKVLANAEEIKLALSQAAALRPDAAVKEAGRSVSKVARFMPALAELADRLDSTRIELTDIFDDLESKCDEVNFSGARLEQVEARLSLLYGLMKKNSCDTVSDLISLAEKLALEVDGSSSVEDRIREMETEVEAARAAYLKICEELHRSRAEAAVRFAGTLRESLVRLEMDRALFEVELCDAPQGPCGTDSVCFKFSSTGTAPVDVAKCASGGEISRIMLCLKSVMAGFSGMPTLVFDEIDTGVSGSVADSMGAMICGMGEKMQVIAITHLPQVAAKGNAHFVVSKTMAGDGTVASTLKEVKGEARINEIARLLSGATITPQAVANAKSLLNCD